MYYNQRDYAHIPYPAQGYEKATVKSGGCGPCCASMIVEGLTGQAFPPEQSAVYSINEGARVSGGTNMHTLGRAIARDYTLDYQTSSSIDALVAHLKAGGWAIVNVGGNRSGYVGLFSNSGHYVVARAVDDLGRVVVWDPGNYNGKYKKAGRTAATMRGDDILVMPELVDLDAQNRSPRYYLFALQQSAQPAAQAQAEPVVHTPSFWAQEQWEQATRAGVLSPTNPQGNVTREQLAIVLARLGLLGDAAGK